jgi:hypothetical protein
MLSDFLEPYDGEKNRAESVYDNRRKNDIELSCLADTNFKMQGD